MAWTIDATHSQVEFSAKHMMFTTVRGRFNSFSGTLDLNETNPEQSYAEGTVEIASIDTRDANRDGHLRSADFFDAENHPTMTFRTTNIRKVAEDQYKVTGDLTIRGTTQPETFDVTYLGQGVNPWGKTVLGFSADATINRKDFGLNWNVALEKGGWLVSEEIKIHIEVQAVQEEAAPEAAEAVPA